MDEYGIQRDSAAWLFFVKITFAISLTAMGLGIFFSPCDLWVKGYMAMGTLFTVGASITMSKTLRDEHEAKKIINRISTVKTEKILKEYGDDV